MLLITEKSKSGWWCDYLNSLPTEKRGRVPQENMPKPSDQISIRIFWLKPLNFWEMCAFQMYKIKEKKEVKKKEKSLNVKNKDKDFVRKK